MKDVIEKIEVQIAQAVYPGASLAWLDKTWRSAYFGTQDGLRPVKPGLTYDLASVSKVVGVGTVAIALLNRGILEIDQPLSYYYPAFRDTRVSLRQLLTHTSGIDPYIPNRDSLNAAQLRAAINELQVGEDRAFRYTDVNFLLLGFMLEEFFGQPLETIIKTEVLEPFGMRETQFGPVSQAVPTLQGVSAGRVHDPKARVLGPHAGSAGLFSTIDDLQRFLDHYLQDDFAHHLTQDFGGDRERARSIAWDKKGDWLAHTGYTGTFVLFNRPLQKAAIFLSNRTFYKDERPQWKKDRNELMALIMKALENDDD